MSAGGHGDDFRRQRLAAQGHQQLDAVHLRQQHFGHDDVGGIFPVYSQGFLAVAGLADLIAASLNIRPSIVRLSWSLSTSSSLFI